MLGSTEEDMALSRTLSQLSDVTSKVSQLHADQADVDFYVISELIKDYVSVIQAIKVCSTFLAVNCSLYRRHSLYVQLLMLSFEA